MKTMTIYALMGKIYNNNQDMPKKIKYGDRIYEWKEYDVGYPKKKKVEWQKEWGYVAEENRTYYYLKHCYKNLDDMVEIIEENNKIEKMIPTSLKGIDNLDEKIEIAHIDTISAIDKINELIDKVNEMNNGQN